MRSACTAIEVKNVKRFTRKGLLDVLVDVVKSQFDKDKMHTASMSAREGKRGPKAHHQGEWDTPVAYHVFADAIAHCVLTRTHASIKDAGS
eukprot:4398162-Amphidinium_carterae.1